jgi:hypothetical protein
MNLLKFGWASLRECIAKKMVKEGDVWGQIEQFVQVNFERKYIK